MVLENPSNCLNFEKIIPDLISYRKFIKFCNVSVLSFVWADNNNCLYYTSNSNCPIKKPYLYHVTMRFFTAFHSIPRVLRVPWNIFFVFHGNTRVSRVLP